MSNEILMEELIYVFFKKSQFQHSTISKLQIILIQEVYELIQKLRKKNLDFELKLSGRVAKTAFHVSTGTLWVLKNANMFTPNGHIGGEKSSHTEQMVFFSSYIFRRKRTIFPKYSYLREKNIVHRNQKKYIIHWNLFVMTSLFVIDLTPHLGKWTTVLK